MDKKAILAVVLSLGIWLGWNELYLKPFQKQAIAERERQEQERAASLKKKEAAAPSVSASNTAKATPATTAAPTKFEVQRLEVSAPNYKLGLANSPEFIHGWELSSYYKALEKSEGRIDLAMVAGFSKQLGVRFNDSAYENLNTAAWSPVSEQGNRYVSTLSGNGVSMERSLTPSDAYYADISYKFSFTNTPPAYIFLELLGHPKRPHDKEGSILGEAPDKVNFAYRDTKGRSSFTAATVKETHEDMAGAHWFGIDTRYFVFAVVPDQNIRKEAGVQIASGFVDGEPAVRGNLVVPTKGAKDLTINARLFFGPKHMEYLNAADPILTDTIDFGWTSFIAIPILRSLKWLYGYVHNYGIAIIILTFIIKVLLFPLTYKSMKSMSKMAKLQPQLNAIREKYKDDKEKLNQEMMQFMRTHGYNPIGGCLPILLQMPIFFALYRVLFNSIELYQAPFGIWIHDLSTPDPYYVTPILLTALMYFQQKLSPNTAQDPVQQKMLQFMPVMFGVFMLLLPSGLTIYMVVNSVVSIAQQVYLNNKFGVYAANAAKPAKA